MRWLYTRSAKLRYEERPKSMKSALRGFQGVLRDTVNERPIS